MPVRFKNTKKGRKRHVRKRKPADVDPPSELLPADAGDLAPADDVFAQFHREDRADLARIEQDWPKSWPSVIDQGTHACVLDLDRFRLYCMRQCTLDDIAAFFGIARATLKRVIQTDPHWNMAWQQGRAAGRNRLRDIQWRIAEAGDSKMAQWLGVQYLGQRRDQPADAEAELSFGPDGSKTLTLRFSPELAQQHRELAAYEDVLDLSPDEYEKIEEALAGAPEARRGARQG